MDPLITLGELQKLMEREHFVVWRYAGAWFVQCELCLGSFGAKSAPEAYERLKAWRAEKLANEQRENEIP